MRSKLKNSRGFTLIEVLLVVAIVAILAGIVILAINPGKQLGDSRNAQRRVDVNTIMNALYQGYIDLKSPASVGLPTTPTDICATNAPSCPSNMVNLSALTNSGRYIVSIPKDPLATNDVNNTHYQLHLNTTNYRLVVTAPWAEQGETISVTR